MGNNKEMGMVINKGGVLIENEKFVPDG